MSDDGETNLARRLGWQEPTHHEMKKAMRDALDTLSYRERRILELRYGLGGEPPRTLDEVGRTFNLTRGRISQLQKQALGKLTAALP